LLKILPIAGAKARGVQKGPVMVAAAATFCGIWLIGRKLVENCPLCYLDHISGIEIGAVSSQDVPEEADESIHAGFYT
jgi:hypothetical protein